MRIDFAKVPFTSLRSQIAPVLIGAGLAILLVHPLWPSLPIVTAMSFIALGSSYATISKAGGSANSLPALLSLHLVIYASLYAVFVGAVCDAADRDWNGTASMTQLLDVAMSAAVMALVVRTCVACLLGGGNRPDN